MVRREDMLQILPGDLNEGHLGGGHRNPLRVDRQAAILQLP